MSLTQRFDNRASQYPVLLAVKSGHAEMTYDELNRRANSVADAVNTALNEKFCRVALLMDHEAPAIAAMIGVLKSANIYVPLDPADPFERLNTIIQDAEVSLIVTDQENQRLSRNLAGAGSEVISVDDLAGVESTRCFEEQLLSDKVASLL